eukprot:463175_1
MSSKRTLRQCLEEMKATNEQTQAIIDQGYDLESLDDFEGLSRVDVISFIGSLEHWNPAKAGRLAGKIQPAGKIPSKRWQVDLTKRNPKLEIKIEKMHRQKEKIDRANKNTHQNKNIETIRVLGVPAFNNNTNNNNINNNNNN